MKSKREYFIQTIAQNMLTLSTLSLLMTGLGMLKMTKSYNTFQPTSVHIHDFNTSTGIHFWIVR